MTPEKKCLYIESKNHYITSIYMEILKFLKIKPKLNTLKEQVLNEIIKSEIRII